MSAGVARMRARRALRDERGFVAGSEALIFGVLICVVGTLVVLNGWAVVDARFVAAAAAREAVRAVVEAPTGADVAATATGAAVAAARAHGRDPASLTVAVSGPSAPVRCAPVEVRTTISVAPVGVPLPTGASGGPTGRVLTVHASAREVIDPFRAGLPPGLACPW